MQINELIFQNDLKIAKNKALMVENEQKLVSKKDYQAIQDAKNKVDELQEITRNFRKEAVKYKSIPIKLLYFKIEQINWIQRDMANLASKL